MKWKLIVIPKLMSLLLWGYACKARGLPEYINFLQSSNLFLATNNVTFMLPHSPTQVTKGVRGRGGGGERRGTQREVAILDYFPNKPIFILEPKSAKQGETQHEIGGIIQNNSTSSALYQNSSHVTICNYIIFLTTTYITFCGIIGFKQTQSKLS